VSTAGVVLAAGGGARFAGVAPHKLLARFRGRPVWEWSVEAVLGADLDAVFVVTGAVDLGPLPGGVVVVEAPDWASGQAVSLHAGWSAAERAGHDAIVIGLADSPLVPVDAWRAVAATTATPIAVADFGGRRLPPVRLAKEVWPLLPTKGDEGARQLFTERPDLVTAVPCTGEPADIDTVEDLERWS
jgi:molybdenum cofactor cytidylyltransferase